MMMKHSRHSRTDCKQMPTNGSDLAFIISKTYTLTLNVLLRIVWLTSFIDHLIEESFLRMLTVQSRFKK